MIQIKSISIPETCHQQWQQMTPTANGRHCEQCCKTVTDFTKMTNNEIITHLNNKTNTCGRFGTEQLIHLNNSLELSSINISWRKLGIAVVIAGVFSVSKAEAQVKVSTVMHPRKQKTDQDNKLLTNPKRISAIDCKAYTAKQIIISDEPSTPDTICIKPQINEYTYTTLVGGISVVRYSFFRRLRNKITWPIRKIFQL